MLPLQGKYSPYITFIFRFSDPDHLLSTLVNMQIYKNFSPAPIFKTAISTPLLFLAFPAPSNESPGRFCSFLSILFSTSILKTLPRPKRQDAAPVHSHPYNPVNKIAFSL